MVHSVTASFDPATTPAGWATQVLGVTASAWQLAPRSPQALARRAAYGYVPRRVRLRAAAALLQVSTAGLAHSW